jgi:hypothetical protein
LPSGLFDGFAGQAQNATIRTDHAFFSDGAGTGSVRRRSVRVNVGGMFAMARKARSNRMVGGSF